MKLKKLFAVMLLLIAIFTFASCKKDALDPFGKTEPIITESSTTEPVTEATTAVTTTKETTTKKAEPSAGFSDPLAKDRVIVDPTEGNPYLVVVNAKRAADESYKPVLTEIFDTGYYMEEGVTPYYEKMYSAAKKDGITLTPYSAYRSYDRQKNNYINLTKQYMSQYKLSEEEAAKKAATVILPPGTSEHNLGLAMDICNTRDDFAYTKEYKWLTENAHKYGFILRYTADKQDITGIVPEPWHWRFVGVEYAESIKNSGLCLEEYLGIE